MTTEDERREIRRRHLREVRHGTSGCGVHHVTLISGDVERTIRFYQDVLEFPLTTVAENPGHEGSSRVLFDVGDGDLLAFADFPGLALPAYREVLGGLHHIAIRVPPERWSRLRGRLDEARVPYHQENGVSLRFADPDGTPLELTAAPPAEAESPHRR
ncbi:VOC family protein [Bailinhaonella thermotolerans]|uniref:VOC family protein n=1 Tax=Bailinhaonella thermotolerans TaxID=1070861 RepID=A0A3A4ADM8_9ACTN|nr:VOC family protein [Bailinhaonella thermotolerans]RJL26531.1 VOC family protein [Bailinhaonella thermotolerans]